jgi:hypothetical protein
MNLSVMTLVALAVVTKVRSKCRTALRETEHICHRSHALSCVGLSIIHWQRIEDRFFLAFLDGRTGTTLRKVIAMYGSYIFIHDMDQLFASARTRCLSTRCLQRNPFTHHERRTSTKVIGTNASKILPEDLRARSPLAIRPDTR